MKKLLCSLILLIFTVQLMVSCVVTNYEQSITVTPDVFSGVWVTPVSTDEMSFKEESIFDLNDYYKFDYYSNDINKIYCAEINQNTNAITYILTLNITIKTDFLQTYIITINSKDKLVKLPISQSVLYKGNINWSLSKIIDVYTNSNTYNIEKLKIVYNFIND